MSVTSAAHNAIDTTVLIPAAGKVNESLLPLSASLLSAMIPVNGKPVIYWSLSYLTELGFSKFVIAVPERNTFLERLVRRVFGHKVELSFVTSDEDRGVGYTIIRCREHIRTTKLLIVLGDTLFRLSQGLNGVDHSYVLYQEVGESFRWCLVEFDDSSVVREFVEKPRDYAGEMRALIGVYAIHEAGDFFRCAQKALEMKANNRADLEISDILRCYQKTEPIYAYRCADWFDCGNIDNLLKSRRRLLHHRAFNHLTVDEFSGTITKRSQHKEKLIDEIQYYHLLPSDVGVFFPRVISHGAESDDPHLTMEYYSYPTLAELYLFENLNPRIWEQIFRHLFDIIQRFLTHRSPLDHGDYYAMYIRKTENRLNTLCASSSFFQKVITDYSDLHINGKRYRNFWQLWPAIKEFARRLGRPEHHTLIHGDMGFSNILYDVNSRVCRFVDPRGSFGSSGIYGDIKYDVAKLYHSVEGCYDFMTNDLFDITWANDQVTFEVYKHEEGAPIKRLFDSIFFQLFNRWEVRLIEGLLFITMCPLHDDSSKRQKAMYVTGLKILNEVIDENLY